MNVEGDDHRDYMCARVQDSWLSTCQRGNRLRPGDAVEKDSTRPSEANAGAWPRRVCDSGEASRFTLKESADRTSPRVSSVSADLENCKRCRIARGG
jgi:hypothetical protein